MQIPPTSLTFFRPSVANRAGKTRRCGSRIARGALANFLFLAATTSALAQGLCFEPGVTAVAANSPQGTTVADIDGDGDLDVAFVDNNALYVSRNLDNATFAPRELVYQAASGVTLGNPVAADFDGDLDVDLAFLRFLNQAGGGISVAVVDLMRNNGSGTFTFVPGTLQIQQPVDLLGADFDGDLDQDLLVTLQGSSTVTQLLNDGAGVFSQANTVLPANFGPVSAVVGDFDGDLDIDIVSRGATPSLNTLRNDGTGHFSLLNTYAAALPAVLADLDGDGDSDLVTIGFTTVYVLQVRMNLGGGTFSAETTIPGFSSTYFSQQDVAAGDLDGDGDVDLVVTSGWAPRLTVFRNLGNATFEVSGDLATDSTFLRGVRIADLDGDSDPELLVGSLASPVGVRFYRSCRIAGVPTCLGDGSGPPCPCGNNSAPSAKAGCLNSIGGAGTLQGVGRARLSNDTLVLMGAGMTNSSALYFQGTSAFGNGTGIAFGDGLRCASGSVKRLGVLTNVGGSSAFPGPSSPSVSVLGLVTSPGERVYQTWYRNTANFCAPEGFNLTNGLRLLWTL